MGGEGKRGGCVFATSQITLLHMKILNKTKSPIFVLLCFLSFFFLFPKATF